MTPDVVNVWGRRPDVHDIGCRACYTSLQTLQIAITIVRSVYCLSRVLGWFLARLQTLLFLKKPALIF